MSYNFFVVQNIGILVLERITVRLKDGLGWSPLVVKLIHLAYFVVLGIKSGAVQIGLLHIFLLNLI